MDAPSFKWPLANYRDYLIAQVKKSKVRVLLGTPATPEILIPEDYDVLIAALGATPKLPPIPGAERCINIFQVFGHEGELGKRCVVIGGSESGTEAGMYLAENGHDTVVLTRQSDLAPDATPIHYREIMQEFYEGLPHFRFLTNAAATEVGDGYVAYRDADGNIQRLECDSVVALGGMQAHQQEAMALYACAGDFYMIGDCRSVGNLHTGARDAYAVTHQF
jgi:NADPH-dependent 2,4-dienoyl-CoA reductase/sulfur reductase-like enzyme